MRTIPLRGVLTLLFTTAGNCSRARVESMNKMNEGVIAAQQKRFVDAVKLLESAAAIDPQNDQVFWNMAMCTWRCASTSARVTTCRRASR
jgi:hypothetical protein